MTWWQNIKKLFQESVESTPAIPAFHEVLQRDAVFLGKFELWKIGLDRKRFFNWLIDEYILFENRPNGMDETLAFLNHPSSKGFVIYLHKTNFTKIEAQFLLEYLKEKTQILPYIMQVADIRSYNRPAWVETVERYYLKPSQRIQSGEKKKQLYGNVKIELVYRNEKVYQIKFSASHYQDHMYEAPQEFSELMRHICY